MADIISAYKENRLVEAFAAGTAFFIAPVGHIHFRGKEIHVPMEEGASGVYTRIVKQWLMDIMYGIKITDTNDEHILREEHVSAAFGESKVPGVFWVDSFPFLRHVPVWIPGASARKFGSRCKPAVMETRDGPFKATKDSLVRIRYTRFHLAHTHVLRPTRRTETSRIALSRS